MAQMSSAVEKMLEGRSVDELRELIMRLCKEVPEAAKWLETEAAAPSDSPSLKPYAPPGVKPESHVVNPEGMPKRRKPKEHRETEDQGPKYQPPIPASKKNEDDDEGEQKESQPLAYKPNLQAKPAGSQEVASKPQDTQASSASPAASAATAAPVTPPAKPQMTQPAAPAGTTVGWGARPANIVPATQGNPSLPQQAQAPQQRPPVAAAGHVERSVAPVQSIDPFAFTSSMIFKANKKTWDECINRGIFGLPENQWKRVSDIKMGQTALFLLDFVENNLVGLFVPTSPPGYNIEPDAWKGKAPSRKSGESPFPAQIRVKQLLKWKPVNIVKFEHLLRFHNNNATFDLCLDQKSTQDLVQILLSEQR